jgi:hypothetical protein
MLVGPDAPLVISPIRATLSRHSLEFLKPTAGLAAPPADAVLSPSAATATPPTSAVPDHAAVEASAAAAAAAGGFPVVDSAGSLQAYLGALGEASAALARLMGWDGGVLAAVDRLVVHSASE